MKIAIIKADDSREELLAKHGCISDLFEKCFIKYLNLDIIHHDISEVEKEHEVLSDEDIDNKRSQLILDIDVFNAKDFELPQYPENYNAILITGSKHSVYEDEEWIKSLISYIQNNKDKSKYIGICFGHQILAYALGGRVERAKNGWGLGINEYVIHSKQEFMQPFRPLFNAVAVHQDQVTKLPKNTQCLASSAHCPCSMIKISNNIIGVQFHPEFHHAYARDLYQIIKDLFPKEQYIKSMESLDGEYNHDIIWLWIINFIKGGQNS